MRAFFAVLAVLAVSLALVGWLVLGQQVAEPLVPSPENVVQNFVTGLSTGRYEPARQRFGDDLQSPDVGRGAGAARPGARGTVRPL